MQNVLIEGCITAIVWWCWGFGVDFGNVATNNNGGFVGRNYFLAINQWINGEISDIPFGSLIFFLQVQHALFLLDLFQKELILEFTSFL